MRKNVIAMSVATLVAGLGLAGGASAAVFAGGTATNEVVNPGGLGHQLIVPYYSAQGGNATLFNITNTDTVNGKALKVRFRSASNSDDVFDFQLFLSPGDVWAANISQGADGRANLTTSDKSCTLPAGVGTAGNGAFVTARLPAAFTAAQNAALTREGYIEIFNMADIHASALFTAVKHVAGVPPCTAATMATLAVDPATEVAANGLGLFAPTTGLMANWIIINVARSGASSGESISITATDAANVPQAANLVFFPQTGAAVAGTGIDTYTADPALRATLVTNGDNTPYVSGSLPIVSASNFDMPDMSTPYVTATGLAIDPIIQAENLSRALATTAVINEYLGDTSINGNTDWVFSMPTRRYSVALDYRPMPALPPTRAFTQFGSRDFFVRSNTSVNVALAQICTTTSGVTFFNREEGTAQGTSFVISPNPPVAAFALCGETSVLSFNSTPVVAGVSPVLGATVAYTNFITGAGFVDGWAIAGTPGPNTAFGGTIASPNVNGNGLPVVGKAFLRAAPGAGVGFFGASWEHRYLRPVAP